MPKFDVVCGNPPYQSSTKKSNQANALWPRFFEIFANISKFDGYIQIVIPTVWMANDPDEIKSGRMTISRVRNKILSKLNIKSIVNTTKINSLFNVGTDICYLTLQNNDNKNENMLLITDTGSKEINQNIKFIPLNINDTIFNILNKTLLNNNKKIKIYSNPDLRFTTDTRRFKYMSFKKTKIHKYPSVNTSAQYTKKQYIWSSIPHPYQYQAKIIYSDSGYARPFYDKGKFGLNSHAHAIFIENQKQADNLIFYFNSKLVKYLESLIPTSGFATGITKIINYLPEINISRSWTNQELYEYFNLTQEEIKYIESQIK